MAGGASAVSTVTCHTDGCENDGVPIEMDLTVEWVDEWGETHTSTVTSVVCGPCGQPITDIQDVP
jgi:hypothetical protein